MTKKSQKLLTICLIFLMSLACLRIDNTSNIFNASTTSYVLTDASGMGEAEVVGVNRGCSRIEKQDYLSASNSTVLATSFFRRAQSNFRNHERHEVSVASLDLVSKVVAFSILMILIATGGAGLSMPFRCLVRYIQDMDGKKKIA